MYHSTMSLARKTVGSTPPDRKARLLSTLATRWQTFPPLQRGLILLILLRWGIALLFWLNILPLELRYGAYLHHGGDQSFMFRLAYTLFKGKSHATVIGIGQPLIMLPWVALIRPHYYEQIVIPLVIINGFIFAAMSIWSTGQIAYNLLRNTHAALWSALLWTITPLISYFIFFWHSDFVNLRSVMVPKLGWLQGLADPPAIASTLLGAALLTACKDAGKSVTFWKMVAVGAVLSVAIMFRIHMAFMVGFLLVYLLIAHGFRAFLVVCLSGLITYIPQALYNQTHFHLPFTSGYITLTSKPDLQQYLAHVLTNLPFHPQNLVDTFGYFIGARSWLLIPLIIVAGIIAYTAYQTWREFDWQTVALLIVAPLVYLLPILMSWPFRDDPVRFIMPILPFLIISAIYIPWLITRKFIPEYLNTPTENKAERTL